MFVFNQNPSPYLHTPTPPSYTFLNLSASLVSILGDYVSLSLFSLIKENAIQLSLSWPIASLFSRTSYCYSLALYGCQSGTQPVLFPGTDVVALAIMTFLLVSSSHRSAPEDTVPPSWMSPVILSRSLLLIIRSPALITKQWL